MTDVQYYKSTWWVFLVEGLVAFAFGLLFLFYPEQTFDLLVLFFGIFALISGIVFTIGAFANRSADGWFGTLVIGLISLLVGILTFVNPDVTATVLLLLISFRAVFVGFLLGVGGWEVRKEVTGEWLVILVGLISFIFGFWMLFNLDTAGTAVAIVMGLYLTLYGLTEVIASFRVRSM
ncbi:MAG: hypothetical protein GTO18_09155 [Anaerolineales bacterium]|nr:hypothetical protein [Anaerolineales bacterium]